MKKIFIVLLMGLLTTTSLFAELVGSSAPEVNARKWYNANGQVTLKQFENKVVVVEFWATWCPPCRQAIPHLVKLYNENKDKGLVVIGIANERQSNKLEKFIKEMKMDYIVGVGSSTAQKYNVRGIPHAFVIVDGKVVWEGHPMGGLDQAVEKALKEKSPKKEEKKIEKKIEKVIKATK